MAEAQLALLAGGLEAFYCHQGPLDRSGIAQYIHVIRAPEDPERSPRPKGGRKDRAPHRTLRKELTVERAKEEILGLLRDGRPRTFHRIGLDLLDLSADVLLGGPMDGALWELLEEGRLAHTMRAPIYFRLSGCDCG